MIPRDPGKPDNEGYRPWMRWAMVGLVVFYVLVVIRISFEADWSQW